VVRNLTIQVVIFFGIFNILSWFQTLSMLSIDTQLSEEPMVLNTIMDEQVDLLSNDKKTVLYFFAPWCKICHFSIDNLEDLYLDKQDVNVIAVALDYMDVEQIRKFTQQHQLTFPIAMGTEKVKHEFSISAYPSYYVLDENNRVISKSVGYSTEAGMYIRTL